MAPTERPIALTSTMSALSTSPEAADAEMCDVVDRSSSRRSVYKMVRRRPPATTNFGFRSPLPIGQRSCRAGFGRARGPAQSARTTRASRCRPSARATGAPSRRRRRPCARRGLPGRTRCGPSARMAAHPGCPSGRNPRRESHWATVSG